MKRNLSIIAFLCAAVICYGQSNHYLTKEEAPHDTTFIGPPPAFGSLLFEQDFHMYQYGKTLRKTERGKQSQAQRDWQRDMVHRGYKYMVIRSIDEFIDRVTDYLLL